MIPEAFRLGLQRLGFRGSMDVRGDHVDYNTTSTFFAAVYDDYYNGFSKVINLILPSCSRNGNIGASSYKNMNLPDTFKPTDTHA